jgi:hypothetical protein
MLPKVQLLLLGKPDNPIPDYSCFGQGYIGYPLPKGFKLLGGLLGGNPLFGQEKFVFL